jgi:hypothetical protein
MTVFLNAKKAIDDYSLRLVDINNNDVYRIKANVFPQQPVGDKPWEDGFGYQACLKLIVPPLSSGVYLWDNKVPFVVKARKKRMAILYSCNTENAYSSSGGKSLYNYNSSDKQSAHVVSFQRPIGIPQHSADFIKWYQQQNKKDVGFITDIDMDDYDNIADASLLLIVGHSEYWTREARLNFDRFVDGGGDALILSGNTMWWQIRYNSTKDKIICYKSLDQDPCISTLDKTVNWSNPCLEYPILNSIGVTFDRGGFGTQKDNPGWEGYKIVNASSPLLAGSGLQDGDTLHVRNHEADSCPLIFSNNIPCVDNTRLGFKKIELIGYDKVINDGALGYCTWIAFQKHESSGRIINISGTDWCAEQGMRKKDHQKIKSITETMIGKLLNKEDIFSN